MTEALEILDTIIAAHIPTDVMRMIHHDLGNGRGPRPASYNCYLTDVEHSR